MRSGIRFKAKDINEVQKDYTYRSLQILINVNTMLSVNEFCNPLKTTNPCLLTLSLMLVIIIDSSNSSNHFTSFTMASVINLT